jgi:hypothetical protein
MSYLERYNFLKKIVNYKEDRIALEHMDIYNFSFSSEASSLLPGNSDYYCEEHEEGFKGEDSFVNPIGAMPASLHIPDSKVTENIDFRYHIFRPHNLINSKDIILLFHGFNEKHWDKYLPWAEKIAQDTRKMVVLFPIAFHMNRAPQSWSDMRKMYVLTDKRRKKYPNVVKSSLSNVAMSMRLHSMPQRFVWSGMQTYFDVIQFVEECRAGKHPLIDKDCSPHFFTYSIGGLLAEIIKLTNHKAYFSNSKICMFCGGAVFNRLSPVSKFIIDSEANVALYSYLVEHIGSHMKKDARLGHYLHERHPEGFNFYCMFDIRVQRAYREQMFSDIREQVLAIPLKKDTVIPSYEVINTLQGVARNIDIAVETYDFPYDYIHENPFPAVKAIEKQVDEEFRRVFDRVSGFLK